MKYFRVGIPILVVLSCVFNAIAAYGADNGMAIAAYITALCGWMVVALDEYLTFRREKRIENVSDSVA
jgi:uncharacterized protein (DUF486 family)